MSKGKLITLWVLSALVAALFLFAGGFKLLKPEMAKTQFVQIGYAAWFAIFIGICEVLGGLGLVLPGLFRTAKYLTPLAAVGLTIIMIGAVVVSLTGFGIGTAVPPFIVGLLCAFVAYERGVKHV